MESLSGVALTGAAVFAATNVDGLLLAAALLSSPRTRPRDVVAGTYAGIGALYGASAVASLVSLVIPPGAVALLGLLPIAIGLKQILRRDTAAAEMAPAQHGVLAVAGINVAFGADNRACTRHSSPPARAMPSPSTARLFAVLTALLCYAAHRLVHHPGLGAPLRRYGPRLVPWVLVALGAWILLGAA